MLGQTYLPLIVSVPHVISRRIRSLLGHDYSTYGVGIVPKYVAETYDSMLYCKTVEYSQIDRSKKVSSSLLPVCVRVQVEQLVCVF